MIERRAMTRVKLVLPALCWGKARPDFYAVTDDVTGFGIRFKSATVPAVGERLTCSIRHAGSIETRVIRAEKHRFAVRVLRAEYPLRLVARNLVSLANEQNARPPAERAAPRIVPREQEVVVTTALGATIPGRVLNISVSGAAVSLDRPLAVGTLIMIGNTPAKVARAFDNGIGAAFLSPLADGRVGPEVVL
ncbi:hypothetical protein ASG40_03805 [Methylobacterium sp. Leaf399]|uniref:PilZ domain-containing protein n=1 Tax=unclassified Methylobacterium TaxID=2615210 RepID=UPI0006FD6503|nr:MULTISPECIES: PilZ domain-containing protein [unclassified Methylobacterium]KQP61852.1 hypothetical protein ASF39_03510 [Methylobacterium sp. Leaf108]KQT20134.1 hypothetical protein ASG40_03805 [Methylobacterium sp. Leaf399]KQT78577.1 hypothetical protein ASG59_08245 [Methylobacterium sp. Leaf466]